MNAPLVTVAFGTQGFRAAREAGELPVIVDVLRFSSTVVTAIANGFTILPAGSRDAAEKLAERTGAIVSGQTGTAAYSLSPLDYLNPRSPGEVILVSPNGAALSEAIQLPAFGLIACLVNARAAGRRLRQLSDRLRTGITLIAAGETREDQEEDLENRRFAVEDYLGCGAILSEIQMRRSVDATVCLRAFEACRLDYATLISESPSGRYLAERGHAGDITHCLQRSIYDVLPVVRNGRIEALDPDDPPES